jgi:hypothetical protein
VGFVEKKRGDMELASGAFQGSAGFPAPGFHRARALPARWIRAASILPGSFPPSCLSSFSHCRCGRRSGVEDRIFAATKLPALAFIKVINRPLLSMVKRNGSALASLLASRDPPVQSQAMSRSSPPLNGTPEGSRQRASPDLQLSQRTSTTASQTPALPRHRCINEAGLVRPTSCSRRQTWNTGQVCSHRKYLPSDGG